MMSLDTFVMEHNVEKSICPPDIELFEAVKGKIGVEIGVQLKDYLLQYGYLAYESVELYGVNTRQGLESDLVKQTMYLHHYFPCANPFIAIENRGEGIYSLVDGRDEVYFFIPENNGEIQDTGMQLYEYILKRFEATLE